MILEFQTIVMMPIPHLCNKIEPYDRWCVECMGLGERYRAIVNAGIKAYQLHTYLELVDTYYGIDTMLEVRKAQLSVLEDIGDMEAPIEPTLDLVHAALETNPVSVPSMTGNINIPIEMNIALKLLLDDKGSPDCVADALQRLHQIREIGVDVDWAFSQGLIRGRESITDIFTPVFNANKSYQSKHELYSEPTPVLHTSN